MLFLKFVLNLFPVLPDLFLVLNRSNDTTKNQKGKKTFLMPIFSTFSQKSQD